MKPVVGTVLCVALLAAGCGKSAATIFTRAASSACLTNAGLTPKPVPSASDFVASSATGGAFRVALPDNRVTVSFGESLDDADNIADAYHRFRASNVGIDDVLRRDENAIMLWHVHPADADIATITNCLKG